MKKFFCTVLLCTLVFFAFTEAPGNGIGADAAYPSIEKVLKNIDFQAYHIYEMTADDLERLITKSAEIQINIFELFDCMHRYLTAHNFRVRVPGDLLRKINEVYILDGDMVGKLMPFDKLDYLETGVRFNDSQNALDVYLTEKYQADLELGIGFYETHFGFKHVEPLCFYDCFGIKVKTKIFNITKPASKLHLYDRGKGSFHVQGFFRGKHWYLDLIEKR